MSAVIVVRAARPWPAELLAIVTAAGHELIPIDDVRQVPFFVLAGGVAAVLVEARGLELLGGLALRRCREVSPDTAIVAVAAHAAQALVMRALESGATAFLSWPAPAHVVAQALRARG